MGRLLRGWWFSLALAGCLGGWATEISRNRWVCLKTDICFVIEQNISFWFWGEEWWNNDDQPRNLGGYKTTFSDRYPCTSLKKSMYQMSIQTMDFRRPETSSGPRPGRFAEVSGRLMDSTPGFGWCRNSGRWYIGENWAHTWPTRFSEGNT